MAVRARVTHLLDNLRPAARPHVIALYRPSRRVIGSAFPRPRPGASVGAAAPAFECHCRPAGPNAPGAHVRRHAVIRLLSVHERIRPPSGTRSPRAPPPPQSGPWRGKLSDASPAGAGESLTRPLPAEIYRQSGT